MPVCELAGNVLVSPSTPPALPLQQGATRDEIVIRPDPALSSVAYARALPGHAIAKTEFAFCSSPVRPTVLHKLPRAQGGQGLVHVAATSCGPESDQARRSLTSRPARDPTPPRRD